MAYTVIVHVANEDAFLAEMEELPKPSDNAIIITNPRKKDGKPVIYLDQDADTFIYPMWRITFVEVLAQRASREELVEFFRDEF